MGKNSVWDKCQLLKKKERKIFLSPSSKINSKTKVICILENSFLSMAPKVETIKKKV